MQRPSCRDNSYAKPVLSHILNPLYSFLPPSFYFLSGRDIDDFVCSYLIGRYSSNRLRLCEINTPFCAFNLNPSHLWGFGVLGFWGFGYWVVQKFFFLVFLYEKNQGGSYEVAFIPALWMVSSESLKRLYPN